MPFQGLMTRWNLLYLLCLLSIAGCGNISRSGNNTATDDDSATGSGAGNSDHHDHAHPARGPHFGQLIELGHGDYHAELVIGRDFVTMYLLDRAAETSVAIDSGGPTINLISSGRPQQFRLAASPQKGDPSGLSSRFVSEDAELISQLRIQSSGARLSLMIGDMHWSGRITTDEDPHAHSP